MAKDRSFASKVAKSQHLSRKHCSTCGEEISVLHVVNMVKTEKNSHRFKEALVSVCKCNEKDYIK
ncbi:hypothetical protein JW935_17660 [candidate division KSB1 bacterium]|nr:hypothetical protein [candidate division KSB1 bacterium]